MNIMANFRRIVRKIVPEPLVSFIIRPMHRGILSIIFGRRGCKVNIGGQGIFRMSPEYLFRGLKNFGNRHNRGFQKCIEACRGKLFFIDVGAHIGLYSLPVSQALQRGGKVYAFEPADSNYCFLLKHIAYNNISNIEVHQVVVGDVEMENVNFYEHDISGSPFGGLVINKKKAPDTFSVKQKRQICLDDFCLPREFYPDVIKIDVEGAELGVLKGAKRTLNHGNPMIFLSVHPSHLELMGQSVKDIMELLEELEYEVFSVEGDKLNP